MKRIVSLIVLIFIVLTASGCDLLGEKDIAFTMVFNNGEENIEILYDGSDLEIPKYEDYEFLGWYLEEDFVNEVDFSTLEDGSTIYAKWEQVNFVVTLYRPSNIIEGTFKWTKGDDLNPDNLTVESNQLFMGWFLDPDCEEPYVTSPMPGNDLSLYANILTYKDNLIIADEQLQTGLDDATQFVSIYSEFLRNYNIRNAYVSFDDNDIYQGVIYIVDAIGYNDISYLIGIDETNLLKNIVILDQDEEWDPDVLMNYDGAFGSDFSISTWLDLFDGFNVINNNEVTVDAVTGVSITTNAMIASVNDVLTYHLAQDYTNQEVLVSSEETITIWHAEWSMNDYNAFLAVVDAFEIEYPNITVQLQRWDNTEELIKGLSESLLLNEGPNLILGYEYYFNNLNSFDVVYELDEYIYGTNFVLELEDFVSDYYDPTMINDTTYSLPIVGVSDVLLYNKTILDANDISLPIDGTLTWDMMDIYKSSLLGDGENQCNSLFTTPTIMYMHPLLDAVGSTYPMYDYLAVLKQNSENHTVILPMYLEGTYAIDDFKNQDICATSLSSAAISYYLDENQTFDVGFSTIPNFNEETKTRMTYKELFMVNQGTQQEKDASWLFMEFFTNKETSSEYAISAFRNPVRYSTYESDSYLELENSHIYLERMYFDLQEVLQQSFGTMEIIPRLQDPTILEEYLLKYFEDDITQDEVDNILAELINALHIRDEFAIFTNHLWAEARYNVSLVTSYFGNEVTWTSSNTDVLSNEGEFTYLSEGESPVIVILTAEVTYNGITYYKDFIYLVGEGTEN